MEYILVGITILFMIILIIGIIALFKKPSDTKGQTVILSKVLLVIGIICEIAFMIPTVITLILSLISNESVLTVAVFLAISFLGISLIVAYLNCRIIYDEETFVAKNFWGIKRTFFYTDITSVQGRFDEDIKIYIGKRVVRIDKMAVGRNQFLSHAKKQYRKAHNGKAIPISQPKLDIFNGHVKNPGDIIFAYALLPIIIIGLMIFIAVASIPKDTDDLEYRSITVERYEVQEYNDDKIPDLLLYAEGESEYFEIGDYEEVLTDADSFLELCQTGVQLNVGYVYETSPYSIESIVTEDGVVYLTLDAVHSYRWSDVWMLYLIFGVILAFLICYCILSIYVGRNPKKFSKRFVRLFFRDGQLK